MNKELTDKMVGWIETSAQKIGDFATEQIPPFIHEYLIGRSFFFVCPCGLFEWVFW